MHWKSITAAVALAAIAGEAGAYGWYGPEPFRRDRIDSRQFIYNQESFIDRFSFEAQPAINPRGVWQRDGFFGTAGSTRSNEFFVRTHVQKRIEFDAPMFAGVRFRRDEDFDGRYDRVLFGTGYQQGPWEVGVWGDVRGAKEEMDLQLEAAWSHDDQAWLRATLVAADALFNSKQDTLARFEQKPRTLHLDAGLELDEGQWLYGYANINARSEFHDPTFDLNLSDEQFSAGLGWIQPLGTRFSLAIQGQGLYGRRDRQGLAEPQGLTQDLTRQFADSMLELRHRMGPDRQAWYGMRYLSLRERDRGLADFGPETYREEAMLYAGVRWQWRETIAFTPAVFLGHIEARTGTPSQPGSIVDEKGFVGKLAPAVEFLVNRESGARIVVNPTVKLHELGFGGGNVRVHFPF